MKYFNRRLFISVGVVLILEGCSVFGKAPPPSVPQPPTSINNPNSNLVLPQIGNINQQSVAESVAAVQNESQPAHFKQITENRGPGGTVNKISVDNPGNVPDYYLAPTLQQQTDTNNNPDKLSTPNWQWSW